MYFVMRNKLPLYWDLHLKSLYICRRNGAKMVGRERAASDRKRQPRSLPDGLQKCILSIVHPAHRTIVISRIKSNILSKPLWWNKSICLLK